MVAGQYLRGRYMKARHGILGTRLRPDWVRVCRPAVTRRSRALNPNRVCGKYWSTQCPLFAALRSVMQQTFGEEKSHRGNGTRRFNRVTPSLIRVRADEGELQCSAHHRPFRDRAACFGESVRLRICPLFERTIRECDRRASPSDADGVLPKTFNWSAIIRYFPTYTLGNLIADAVVTMRRESVAGDLAG